MRDVGDWGRGIGDLEQASGAMTVTMFTNDTFPRHRHDAFVGEVLAALERQLIAHAGDDDSSWIRWLHNT